MNEGGLLLQEEKEFKRFYKVSLWWVTYRAALRRIGFALFIAFDALLLLFGGWHLLDAFAISYGAEQYTVWQMVGLGQTDLHVYTLENAASDLEAGDGRVISIGDGRYDLYTTLVNSNDEWWAEFTYAFLIDGQQTESRAGFILPTQEKPVAELAVESVSPIQSANLVIENVRWHRVDRRYIPDYPTWASDRLNFLISASSFEQETRFDGETFGRTTFTIENDTAYSYYDVGLFVLLLRGNSVVGVNRTTLSSLESGVEAEVTVNWFGTLPSVSQVQIIPELNIFDLEVYKPLQGESTRDTRTRVFTR
ncbi:hypothetical protein EPN81_02690 [Patescibacteria group bacterium]|nr:MAG: hypothetical protein EPN81_02690 [Patescibacteria group bacterium]